MGIELGTGTRARPGIAQEDPPAPALGPRRVNSMASVGGGAAATPTAANPGTVSAKGVTGGPLQTAQPRAGYPNQIGPEGLPLPSIGGSGAGEAGGAGGFDSNSFLKLVNGITGGGGGGGNGGGTYSAPGGPGTTNTANNDPDLTFISDKIKDEINNPNARSSRAIDMAGSKIRDLAEGQKSSAEEAFSRMGSSGSGAESEAMRGIDRDTASNVSKTAAGIAMGDEDAQRNFLLQAAGPLGEKGAAARADREMALRQYIAQEESRRAQNSADLQRQTSILSLLGNMVGSF